VPFIGVLIKRFGARPLALIGLTGVAAAFLLASRNARSLPLF